MQVDERASVREVNETDVRSLERLVMWQRSLELVVALYHLTKHFPSEEKYGLTSQLRRAGVSIPSNIAEGHARNSQKEFLVFLGHAYGSAAEVYTQLIAAERAQLTPAERFTESHQLLSEVQKMLLSMQRAIRAKV